ncbi:hypothetical protein BpHYR1_013618 [Brachionus plicatilis]|uniref:Uncharacterized protein n=1 Tax=Brachionus plicatilis TaxID=10195 RepID=A0A3M7S3K7_BRAPC|nr:hypothetical protein BpHYR1_013618 [Brachionus plicatilis]
MVKEYKAGFESRYIEYPTPFLNYELKLGTAAKKINIILSKYKINYFSCYVKQKKFNRKNKFILVRMNE